MKTRIISFGALAAAALALISCVQKEIEVSIVPAGEGIPFEIGLNAPDTKTACNNLVTSWTAGDQVNVFHAVAGTADYVSDGAFSYNGDTQKFDGTLASELDPAKSYDWYFFYPYSNYVTTPANGADGGYTMVAPFSYTQTESNNTAHLIRLPLAGKITADAGAPVVAQMHHQASIVKIVVTNNSGVPMVFPKVKFQAPVNVAGNYCVAFTDPENPVFAEHATASKGNTVTVLSEWVTAKAAQSTYYAAVKPFTAAAASELKVIVGDYSKTVNLAAARTFAPGMVYTFNFNYDKAVTIAKLPFSFTGEGGQEALLAMDGVTAEGLGTDYDASKHAPYVIKMDTQDDYIQVRYNEAAGKATIGVKKIGGNGESTFDVMGSVDGIEFTKIETLSVVGAQNAIVNLTTTKTINSSYRCIRFVFNKVSNVGVGPISILKPSSDPELIVTDVANISPVGGNGQVGYTVKNTTDDIQVENVTGCVASATASSGKVNYTINPNYDYKTATGTIVLKSKSKATLTATINLSQLGSNLKVDDKTTKTQEIIIPYNSNSIKADVLSDYFDWSTVVTPGDGMNLTISPASGTANAEAKSVTISSTTAATEEVQTLGTIVFSRVAEDVQTRTVTVKKGETPSGHYYTKVTSITSGGKYLLVSEYGGTKYICSGLVVSNALPLVAATVSNNKIASNTTVDTYAVTITSTSGGYTIVNSNEKYFTVASGKNVSLGDSAPTKPWTLTKYTDNSFIFANELGGTNSDTGETTRSIFIGNTGNSCKLYANSNFGGTGYASTYLTLYKYQ